MAITTKYEAADAYVISTTRCEQVINLPAKDRFAALKKLTHRQLVSMARYLITYYREPDKAVVAEVAHLISVKMSQNVKRALRRG